MPSFEYTALSKSGKKQQGICESDSIKQARQQLRDQGLQLLTIQPTENSPKANAKHTTATSWWKRLSQATLSITDQSLVTRQLATLLEAGISLEESLTNIAEQSDKKNVKTIILGLRTKILEGFSLAKALATYPKAFSRLYCATVGAGEKTGKLEKILTRLAEFIERRQQVRQQMLQAAIYPTLITFVAIGIVSFLLTYVVPKVVEVFIQNGQALPFPTRLLLSISSALQTTGPYIIGSLAIGIFLFTRALKKPAVRYGWDAFLLKLPLIGSTLKWINTARFSHTFSILNAAGVDVLEAMRVSAETVSNKLIFDSLQESVLQVREGTPIHKALQKTTYFPPLSIQLIASGENSGQLGNMLERAAFSQENIVQSRLTLLLNLFEPVIILVMGSVVLFIVLAILLPIFDMNELVG